MTTLEIIIVCWLLSPLLGLFGGNEERQTEGMNREAKRRQRLALAKENVGAARD
jgi:hypothetical protein